jgi:hypothetical protein
VPRRRSHSFPLCPFWAAAGDRYLRVEVNGRQAVFRMQLSPRQANDVIHEAVAYRVVG